MLYSSYLYKYSVKTPKICFYRQQIEHIVRQCVQVSATLEAFINCCSLAVLQTTKLSITQLWRLEAQDQQAGFPRVPLLAWSFNALIFQCPHLSMMPSLISPGQILSVTQPCMSCLFFLHSLYMTGTSCFPINKINSVISPDNAWFRSYLPQKFMTWYIV